MSGDLVLNVTTCACTGLPAGNCPCGQHFNIADTLPDPEMPVSDLPAELHGLPTMNSRDAWGFPRWLDLPVHNAAAGEDNEPLPEAVFDWVGWANLKEPR